MTEGDLRKLLLIFGILTIHSFPEGVAVGVSFADVGLDGGLSLFGVTVPLLAVFMTVAISIHNVPEGVAVSIPLRSMGVDNWRLVAAAVFSSLPQPVGAVVAFLFVSWDSGSPLARWCSSSSPSSSPRRWNSGRISTAVGTESWLAALSPASC